MDVHRAVSACPSCNDTSEIWYYRSKITPVSTVECHRCSFIYEADNFIVALLDLRRNITFSSLELLT
jgi:hypothetical protein